MRARARAGDSTVFFWATLVMWAVSILFEMASNSKKRRELIAVVLGFSLYQAANWAIRFSLSRDPLFVNTAVSLLHSSITSASGTRNLWRILLIFTPCGDLFEANEVLGLRFSKRMLGNPTPLPVPCLKFSSFGVKHCHILQIWAKSWFFFYLG